MEKYQSAPNPSFWKFTQPSSSFFAMLRGMISVVFIIQSTRLEMPPASESNLHPDRNSILDAQASQELSLLNVIDTSIWDPPSPDPVGIDYHPGFGRLIVSDSEVDEMEIFQGANIFEISTSGQPVATCSTLSSTREPSGVAVNPGDGHVFIAEDDRGKIFEVAPARDGDQCLFDQVVETIDTRAFNSYDPEGVAFGEGKLFIADGSDVDGAEVFVLSPGANGEFDGVPPTGDDQVTHFDTLSLGLSDPEGIGYHPERGTLFIVSRTGKVLIETTPSGTALKAYDLSFTGIQKPSGVGIGPGSLNAEKYSIYITARGLDNDNHPDENDGKIFELGLLEIFYLPLMFNN